MNKERRGMDANEGRATEDDASSQRGAASRFAYYGDDEVLEGGVHSVSSEKRARPTGTHSGGAGGTTGGRGHAVPDPDELLLDISEIARTVGMRYTHRIAIPPRPMGDLHPVSPLVGQITLTNTGAALLLRGHVAANLRLECARCLSDTEQEVETELEEEFDLVTSHNAFHQEEVQAVDEDTPASVIQGNVLDLGDLLRQGLLLAAPAQPLCSEECPGIDLSGLRGVTLRREDDEEEAAGTGSADEEPEAANSPFRNLAALMEEKRRREESGEASGGSSSSSSSGAK